MLRSERRGGAEGRDGMRRRTDKERAYYARAAAARVIGPHARNLDVERMCGRCDRRTGRGEITAGPEKDVPYCLRCGERKPLERLLVTP